MSIMILRRPGAAAAAPTVTLNDMTFQNAVTDPSDAYCSIKFKTDGTTVVVADSGSALDWLGQGVAADYTVILEPTSGTLSVGTAGQDLPLTSDREFGVSRTIVGSKGWTGTVSIKRASDGVVVAGPANLSLSALVSGSTTNTGGGSTPPSGGTGNSGINLP